MVELLPEEAVGAADYLMLVSFMEFGTGSAQLTPAT